MRTQQSHKVSVVIRTRNEADWIWKCLLAISRQTVKPYEIVLVDNASTDKTLEIASQFPISKVVRIDDYSPGRALNLGISATSGDFIALISAHCVPTSDRWLETLVSSLSADASLGACYGRQVPLPFTHPADKADLLSVFRPESRIQMQDGYLNNANSILRRKVWEAIKFDESLSNIEDRVWGDSLISMGLKIGYRADASVFHHNGLHRTSSRFDQTPTVRVLEAKLAEESSQDMGLYDSLFEKAIAPVLISNSEDKASLELEIVQLMELLHDSKWEKPVVISELQSPLYFVYPRDRFHSSLSTPMDSLLRNVASFIAGERPAAKYMALFIARMGLPSLGELQGLVSGIVRQNADFSFIAEREYRHIWYRDDENRFLQVDSGMSSKVERRETYSAIYGQGSIFSLENCLSDNLFGGVPAVLVRGDAILEHRR